MSEPRPWCLCIVYLCAWYTYSMERVCVKIFHIGANMKIEMLRREDVENKMLRS